ncbi:hypothetical protein GUJ93_ZPchr0006g43213 [Zizania palustris]|uniref:Protein kinase domain-containing protein n=1 Tax=Zizania palustris TaxID=103762 RepID=A0A8J5VMA6_ZIZPA|nr:hypothetical protein GUJ93_ZPchr0006g43213 [Zizania palustris]
MHCIVEVFACAGWCHRNGVLLLVYDYMPNGSLDRHIFGGPEAAVLDWKQRYNVVTGVASALNYLHHEYDQMVIHRDIKPSNIMLDSTFNARLGDFGLARALETDKTSYTDKVGVTGTLGYIAPECFHTGRATRESDVFAFGAVILEIVCGRRIVRNDAPDGSLHLLDVVWSLHGAASGRILEAVDARLSGEFDQAEAARLLHAAGPRVQPPERPGAAEDEDHTADPEGHRRDAGRAWVEAGVHLARDVRRVRGQRQRRDVDVMDRRIDGGLVAVVLRVLVGLDPELPGHLMCNLDEPTILKEFKSPCTVAGDVASTTHSTQLGFLQCNGLTVVG